MKKTSITLILLLILFGCSSKERSGRKVFVSILPQKFFVEKIAGDFLEVSVMVQPGMSPATYDPLPRQMTELIDAGVFFKVGAPFENSWMKRIEENYPALKIIDTREGIKLRKMKNALLETKNSVSEVHDHAGLDPHIWLSPNLVKIQAQNIFEGLTAVYPEKEKIFRINWNKFKNELDSIHIIIEKKLSGLKMRRFVVFHPSWGYFGDEFNLEQIAIEVEGKEPSPKELTEIIDLLNKNNLTTIFVQPQFSVRSAETIAKEIGGAVERIDPLPEDYYTSLIHTAQLIAGIEKMKDE